MPVEAMNEEIGEMGDSGGGFDGDVDIGTKGSDDPMNSLGIVHNGLVGEDFSTLAHDADLNNVLVIVKADKKG